MLKQLVSCCGVTSSPPLPSCLTCCISATSFFSFYWILRMSAGRRRDTATLAGGWVFVCELVYLQCEDLNLATQWYCQYKNPTPIRLIHSRHLAVMVKIRTRRGWTAWFNQWCMFLCKPVSGGLWWSRWEGWWQQRVLPENSTPQSAAAWSMSPCCDTKTQIKARKHCFMHGSFTCY